MNNDKKKVTEALVGILRKSHEERQKLPNQYVVAYKKISDDELIGYHASTFCQTTQDILQAKRYQGSNPYPQLEVIAKNLKSVLNFDPETVEKDEYGFWEITKDVKENYFADINKDDVYLDPVYLTDGTPPNECRLQIIDLNEG